MNHWTSAQLSFPLICKPLNPSTITLHINLWTTGQMHNYHTHLSSTEYTTIISHLPLTRQKTVRNLCPLLTIKKETLSQKQTLSRPNNRLTSVCISFKITFHAEYIYQLKNYTMGYGILLVCLELINTSFGPKRKSLNKSKSISGYFDRWTQQTILTTEGCNCFLENNKVFTSFPDFDPKSCLTLKKSVRLNSVFLVWIQRFMVVALLMGSKFIGAFITSYKLRSVAFVVSCLVLIGFIVFSCSPQVVRKRSVWWQLFLVHEVHDFWKAEETDSVDGLI